MKYKICAAILVLIASSSHSWAASYLYSCDFPRSSDERGKQSPEKFSMRFAHDDITGEAMVIGNNGVEKVHVVTGAYGISFLEVLGTGAVQTTTIARSGKASHSRHTMMGADIMPSQYYGTCAVSKG
jgi:hypothetical protein